MGNPFVMHTEAERDIVCEKYEVYFIIQTVINETFNAYLRDILSALKTYGRVELYCWCAPKRCHAETIKRWLEKQIYLENQNDIRGIT